MKLPLQTDAIRKRAMIMTALGMILAVSTALPVTKADAASNLMELFQQRRQQRQMPEAQPGAPIQQVAPAAEAKVASTAAAMPLKRVTVRGPAIYDYKPDTLVRIDFTQLDLQTTAATRRPVGVQQDPLTVGMPPLTPALVTLEPAASIDNAMEHLKSVNVLAEKSIAAAIVDFYSSHQKFIWSASDVVEPKAKDVAALFARADEDGLDPDEYAVRIPANSFDAGNLDERQQKLTAFEIEMSARALRYAMDAGEGRIVADRLSGFHDLPRGRVNPRDVLEKLAASDSPVAYLQGFHPQSQWYASLKSELAKLDVHQDDSVRVAPGTLIRPGDANPEIRNVVALITKYAPADYLAKHRDVLQAHANASVYDPELVSAIMDYQQYGGSTPDGVIGRNTVASLQGEQSSVKRDRILYSMERLRWLPHEFGEKYVFVNQPAYRAQFFDHGVEKLGMNVVVGSPTHQTYFFYNKVQTVVFNPSWGVPRSIILNEMLPKIMRDTSYLDRNGYEVYAGGKLVPASAVNWSSVASGGTSVSVRQKPSLDNALGELKILFPNSHDIYMHDTPAKSYFSKDMRALSHGCIRLERPRDMAAAVLGKSVNELGKYFGKNERGIRVADPMPVYITYFTAWPDATTQKVRFYDDIYGRDDGLAKAFAKTRTSRLTES